MNGWIDTSSTRIKEAQNFTTQWLWTYNHERPKMSTGGITSAQKLNAAA